MKDKKPKNKGTDEPRNNSAENTYIWVHSKKSSEGSEKRRAEHKTLKGDIKNAFSVGKTTAYGSKNKWDRKTKGGGKSGGAKKSIKHLKSRSFHGFGGVSVSVFAKSIYKSAVVYRYKKYKCCLYYLNGKTVGFGKRFHIK